MGGSTALNHLAWDRASKAEYDAWKLLADEKGAWDWDVLLPYFRKTEDMAANPESRDMAVSSSRSENDIKSPGVSAEQASGVHGPIKVRPFNLFRKHSRNIVQTSYNPSLSNDLLDPYIKAWNTLDQKTNANPVCDPHLAENFQTDVSPVRRGCERSI